MPLTPWPGLFIAFEGVEGCGKSTQAERLARNLPGAGRFVTLTREPGATAAGKSLRWLLLNPGEGDGQLLTPVAELLLFLADRSLHIEQVVAPALAAGDVVISDRHALSTLVYQGVARGVMDVGQIIDLNRLATGGVTPHLTIVFDIDPEVGLKRAAQRGALNRVDQEPLEFHQRVRQGFLEFAHRLGPAAIIDAGRDPDTVAADVLHVVEHALFDRKAAVDKPVSVPPDVLAAYKAAVETVGCPRCGSTRACRCLVPKHERVDKVEVGLAAVLRLIGGNA